MSRAGAYQSSPQSSSLAGLEASQKTPMAEPDTIQPALVLGVLGIFIAATGVISLALHNLKQGLGIS